MTMVIAVPTGVKVYDWLLTMFRGRLRFTTPMRWSIAFIVTFVIGGMTGVILAIPPLDFVFQQHAVPRRALPQHADPRLAVRLLRRLWLLVPQGDRLHARREMGPAGLRLLVAGFYLAFMPLYVLGFLGMSRRTAYYDEPAWQAYLIVAACGALLIFCGLTSQVIQLVVSIRNRRRTTDFAGDPWDGRALEWSISSPPPEYNFAVLPVVHSRDAFTAMKADGTAYRLPAAYEPIEMPRNSVTGLAIGAAGFVLGFALSGTSGGWRCSGWRRSSARSSRAASPPRPAG